MTAPTKNTPGLDAGFELLQRIAGDAEVAARYPPGAAIIPSDAAGFSALVQRAVEEGRAVVVVLPDGSDIVWRPREVRAALGFLLVLALLFARWADRSRSKDRPMFVPRDWVGEFHRGPHDELPTAA